MKKQVLLLASALLLASCGGSSSEAFSEKSGTPVTDLTELRAPLAKLSENLGKTAKLGAELKVTESVDASFKTKANSELGLKDATYFVKSSGSLNAKAGIDFENVKASGAVDAKLSASAKFPMVAYSYGDDGEVNASLEDKEINIPETSLSLKAYLDDNRGYFDLSGAKSGLVTILGQFNAFADMSKAIEDINDIPGKVKTPEIPSDVIETIKTAPSALGGLIGQYGTMLVSYLETAASMPSVSGQFNISDFVKVEKVDNDYRIAADVSLEQIAPLFSGLLEQNLGPGSGSAIETILSAIDAKVHASITFNETALLSANFSLTSSLKNFDIGKLDSEAASFVTDINASVSLAAGLTFKYGDAVSIEALSAAEKGNYADYFSQEGRAAE